MNGREGEKLSLSSRVYGMGTLANCTTATIWLFMQDWMLLTWICKCCSWKELWVGIPPFPYGWSQKKVREEIVKHIPKHSDYWNSYSIMATYCRYPARNLPYSSKFYLNSHIVSLSKSTFNQMLDIWYYWWWLINKLTALPWHLQVHSERVQSGRGRAAETRNGSPHCGQEGAVCKSY